MAFEPDYDLDTPSTPTTLAGTVADVESGMPFAGALFRLADDGRPNWLTAYSPDDPVRLPDVAAEWGAGDYLIRTLPGYPHATARELEVTVSSGRRARGGSTPAPAMPLDEAERMRAQIRQEEATRAADTWRAAESRLTDDLRRTESKLTDATDRADRLKLERDEFASRVARVEAELSSARSEAAAAQSAGADAKLQYATDLAAVERRHLTELSKLREQVFNLNAEARVAAMELRQAQAGEGSDNAIADRFLGVLENAAGPLITAISERMTAAPAGGATPPALSPSTGDGYADGYPAGYGPAGYDVRPAPAPHALDERHGAVGYEGEAGGAGPLDVDPVSEVFSAAEAAITGAPDAPGVEIVSQLVDLARPVASADDWRSVGADLLSLAVEHATEPARVASYLAPIVAPAAATVRPVLSLTPSMAAKLAAAHFGLDLDRPALAYVGKVLKALKPLVTG